MGMKEDVAPLLVSQKRQGKSRDEAVEELLRRMNITASDRPDLVEWAEAQVNAVWDNWNTQWKYFHI